MATTATTGNKITPSAKAVSEVVLLPESAAARRVGGPPPAVVPAAPRWWWAGVMLLSMSVDALRLWLMKISGGIPRTELDFSGHWTRALAFAVVFGVGCILPGFLMFTQILRSACRGTPAAGAVLPLDTGIAGLYAGAAVGRLDRQTVEVACKTCCVYIVVATVALTLVMASGGGDGLALVITSVFAVSYLRRVAVGWLAEGGRKIGGGAGTNYNNIRARKLTTIVSRGLLVAIPLILLQSFTAWLLPVMSAQQLIMIYPYVLSFVEFLAVTMVFNDNIVEGYSDEALSILARFLVALIESPKVGLLVVTYTTGAIQFQGFVLATLNSVVVEVMARTGVLAMGLGALKVQYHHGWGGCCCPCRTRPRFRLLPLTKFDRFKTIYLGCKTGTGLWAVYMLAIINILGYGMMVQAHDDTDPAGDLRPALRCGGDVYAVVGGGEMLAEVGTMGVGWAVSRFCPAYKLDIPSVRPRGSVVTTVMMWLPVGRRH